MATVTKTCPLCKKEIKKKELSKATIPITYGISVSCHPECVLKYLVYREKPIQCID